MRAAYGKYEPHYKQGQMQEDSNLLSAFSVARPIIVCKFYVVGGSVFRLIETDENLLCMVLFWRGMK